jgi:hypothetical protein
MKRDIREGVGCGGVGCGRVWWGWSDAALIAFLSLAVPVAQVLSAVLPPLLSAETLRVDTRTRNIHKARLHVSVSDQEIISS